MDILNIKKKDNNLESVVNAIKPPIFWKDKQNIIDQVKMWNIEKIQSVLKKLFDLEITFKSNGNINKGLLVKKLLVDVCNLASS